MSNAGAGELAASAIVMIAAAVPVARVMSRQPVRREFPAHPVLGTLAAIGVVAAVAVGLWLFMQSPGTRRAMVIVERSEREHEHARAEGSSRSPT